MRRAERACDSPEFMTAMFNEVEVMTVAFHGGEHPYPVPLNFVHIDGSLYFHCALQGRKLDCLAHDSRVGFSLFRFLGIDRENATTCYQSVCGTGTAELVTDHSLKQRALAALAEKYCAVTEKISPTRAKATSTRDIFTIYPTPAPPSIPLSIIACTTRGTSNSKDASQSFRKGARTQSLL